MVNCKLYIVHGKCHGIIKGLLTLVLLMSASLSLFSQGQGRSQLLGTLTVTIDGVDYEHPDICMYVEHTSDHTLNLSLEEFILQKNGQGQTIPLGNITLTGVLLTPSSVDVESLSEDVEVFCVQHSSSCMITNPNATVPDTSEPDFGMGDNNTANGDNQEAEGGWGDDPEWIGDTYGTLSVNISGTISSAYADLAFDVFVPSQTKTITATFRTANVPATGIDAVMGNQGNLIPMGKGRTVFYTPAGYPASASYRGVVIKSRSEIHK